MFGRNTVRLVVLLCCCLSVLILKSCSLPNKSTIYSVVSPNLGFNTTESILKSRIYYINGLATAKDDAEGNLDRIIAAIGGNEENVLIRLKDNIGFEQDIANYRLAYNMALGGITASGNVTQAADNPTFQIVASIALKIREALPELSDPQAWQYARVLLKAPNANDILRPLLQRFNVQETLINLLGQTIRDRIADQHLDMIRRNTIASLYDNFIWPALDDVRDGYHVLTISNSQGTIFVDAAKRTIANATSQKIAGCFFGGVQVAHMMGSTISSLNDIPLYVTFDEDRVVNLVREVARASGGISDAQGNPVLVQIFT
ncbi:hypothetical protein ACVWXF_000827 [Thermostichus sp. MS-CIW-40]